MSNEPVSSSGTGSDGAEPDTLIGQVLSSRYRVTSRCASGLLGAAYHAEDTRSGRAVVVRVELRHKGLVPPERLAELNARFEREARALRRLTHPNTARVLDFGSTDAVIFVVREYIEGQSLATLLDSELRLEPIRAAHIGRQIARSLTEAHSRNIIHRDLRPANIFLTADNEGGDFVKVADFGIASFIDPGQDSVLTTVERIALGSPCYMAPEQTDGLRATAASDIYSLGIILYEMVAGNVPFDAKSTVEIFAKHTKEPLPEPELPGFPPELRKAWWTVLQRLLAKNPEERPSRTATVSAMLKELREMTRDVNTSIPTDAYLSSTMSLAAIQAMAEEMGYDIQGLGAGEAEDELDVARRSSQRIKAVTEARLRGVAEEAPSEPDTRIRHPDTAEYLESLDARASTNGGMTSKIVIAVVAILLIVLGVVIGQLL